MNRSFFSISGVSFLSRISGYARDVLLAITFGLSLESAIFLVAFEIPNILTNLFAEGPFSRIFIPLLSKKFVQKGREKAKKFVQEVISVFLPLSILFSVVIFFAMPFLLKSLAPGYYFPVKSYDLVASEVQKVEIPMEDHSNLYLKVNSGSPVFLSSAGEKKSFPLNEFSSVSLSPNSDFFKATLSPSTKEGAKVSFYYYPEETFNKILLLSRVMLLALFYVFLINCAGSILNLEGHFLGSQIPFLFVNLLSIFALVLFGSSEHILWILSWCFTLGYGLHCFVVLWQCRNFGFYFHLKKPFFSGEIKAILKDLSLFSMSPLFSYVTVFFVTSAASLFGVVSHRYYLFRLINFPVSLIFVPYSVIFFPKISKLIHSGNQKKIATEVSNALRWLFLFLVPAMFGLFVFSDFIVQILFQYGKFTAENANRLSYFIRIASPAMISIALTHFFVMILTGFRQFRLIIKWEFFLLLGRLIFLFIGIKFIGVESVFLLPALFFSLDAIVFGTQLRRLVPSSSKANFWAYCKIFIAGILMFLSLVLYRVWINFDSVFLQLLSGILLGVIVYFAAIFSLGVYSWRNFYDLWLKKWKLLLP